VIDYPNEVVTKAFVRLVNVPGLAKPGALITLDNGFDHTKPSSFGPGGLRSLDDAPIPSRFGTLFTQIPAPETPVNTAESPLELFQATSLTPLNQTGLVVSQVPTPPSPAPVTMSLFDGFPSGSQ